MLQISVLDLNFLDHIKVDLYNEPKFYSSIAFTLLTKGTAPVVSLLYNFKWALRDNLLFPVLMMFMETTTVPVTFLPTATVRLLCII